MLLVTDAGLDVVVTGKLDVVSATKCCVLNVSKHVAESKFVFAKIRFHFDPELLIFEGLLAFGFVMDNDESVDFVSDTDVTFVSVN